MSRKIIIFDMGGVLVDLDLEGCRNSFKESLGFEEIDKILDPCHQKGIYGDMEEGLITDEEFIATVLASSRPDAKAEEVVEAVWKILVDIAPYKVDLLKKMSETYDIYLLSNNNPIAVQKSEVIFSEAGIPMDKIFIKCYYSYKLKTLKPSAFFYRSVVEDIDAPAEDMLFIDDSMKNVEGAIAAGLPAVHYVPGTDLAALLADTLGDESLRAFSNVEVNA